MKVILLVALIGFAAAIPTVTEKWTSFKKNHGKSYHSIEEENRRMNIYAENLKMIEEHNARFEAGLESYSMAMNRFGDMLPEEISMPGFNETREMKKMLGYSYNPPANVDLPESVDWREQGAVTPIKNQGVCESCWAFSTTGAMEGQLFRKTGKLISLSEQQLIDCSAYGNHGCHRGWMRYSFRYLMDIEGLEREDTYPYEGVDGKCRYNKDEVVPETKVTGYVDIKLHDEEALKAAVATVGPVSVAVNCGNKGFQFYEGGIFYGQTCEPSILDHGVLLVGYGTENGEDYWLAKNSWGTNWGEKGYMKLSRNIKNICGISSMASYPVLA